MLNFQITAIRRCLSSEACTVDRGELGHGVWRHILLVSHICYIMLWLTQTVPNIPFSPQNQQRRQAACPQPATIKKVLAHSRGCRVHILLLSCPTCVAIRPLIADFQHGNPLSRQGWGSRHFCALAVHLNSPLLSFAPRSPSLVHLVAPSAFTFRFALFIFCFLNRLLCALGSRHPP